MGAVSIIILLLLSSCVSLHPRVDVNHFLACIKLCKKSKGLDGIVIDMNINLIVLGKTSVVSSENCICKNKRKFKIVSSKQGD